LSEDELAGLLGSFIPFAKTQSERSKKGDPRLSLQERYENRGDYVKQFSRAARNLVEQRYLLSEDAERMISEAKKRRIR
jgi:Alpha/beta hydrolase domain